MFVSDVFVIAISLFVYILQCDSYQCQSKHMKIVSKRKIPESDFKPLFTMERSSFEGTFHSCLYHCGKFQQCLGFEICKVANGLFRCHGCCEWRKRKVYGIFTEPSNCTYYEQDNAFGNNLAFNKSATLSSQYNSFSKPSNAVDGITTCPSHHFYAASSPTRNSWLHIQLGQTYKIRMVGVYARTDTNAFEANHIHVIVSDENFNHTCGAEYPGPTQVNDVIDFLCAERTVGSNLTILKSPPHDEHLTICEVEVFGSQ